MVSGYKDRINLLLISISMIRIYLRSILRARLRFPSHSLPPPTFAKQIGFIPLVAIGGYIHHPLYREGIYRGASSILSRQDKSPRSGVTSWTLVAPVQSKADIKRNFRPRADRVSLSPSALQHPR